MSDENNDLFEEAANLALNKAVKHNESINEEENEEKQALENSNKKLAIYVSENPGKEFEKLQEAIEGPFAEKFMNIMNDLPDRDFIRYYLKTLEYFKPKVTRKEPEKGNKNENTTIQVNIMNVNKEGEITTHIIEPEKK